MINTFLNYIQKEDLESENIIFDIGARDCEQSIEFYTKFKNSKIYSFECNPNTLPNCEKNIEPYKDRIHLIKGAVCDYDGEITFYPINQEKTITSWKDGNPGASSLFKSNGSYTVEKYIQDEIKTNCHRLDSIMDKHGISNVDFIWMDLQGAELIALKGLGIYLQNVKIIYTEVSYKEIYNGQVMFNEFHNFMIDNGFILMNDLHLSGWQEDAIYLNKKYLSFYKDKINYKYDIVIPVGPNDEEVIYKQLEFTKKKILGYRNIYLVLSNKDLSFSECITIDEKIFPFTIETVSKYHGKNPRNGWYLQQLLKLYSAFIIPDILDNYLVIDSDTFFLKPTKFMNNDFFMFNFGFESHIPYFKHMLLLDESFVKNINVSGICHHMLFNKNIIKEIMDIVERKHSKIFYEVFLEKVSEIDYLGSGASEYELYFNYIIKNHTDKINIRQLKWSNVNSLDLEKYKYFDYISYHHYLR
jgi:FkbM family methyltransferase